MQVLFLDESGDHNLSVIDKRYPLFVLGGVIMEKHYAETVLVEKMNAIKQRLFGTTDIILHTADIMRNRNGFERLKEPMFRQVFYEEINQLMRSIEYKVVACVIRKEAHLSKYGVAALDPYFLSLDILVERLCMEATYAENSALIVAESRDSTLDRVLELAWLNLKIQGTHYVAARKIEQQITALNLRSKTDNIAGLQLADLVVTPIGRAVLGKSIKPDFDIIKQKFRASKTGETTGYGLIILPRTE